MMAEGTRTHRHHGQPAAHGPSLMACRSCPIPSHLLSFMSRPASPFTRASVEPADHTPTHPCRQICILYTPTPALMRLSLSCDEAAHWARSLSSLDTAADLGLETGLDGGDRPTRATALAGEEVQTVLLAEESVGRLADLASDVLDWSVSLSSSHTVC